MDSNGTISKKRLEGKVAIVTGGASGIGEAACRLFAEHGAFVFVADIQDDLGRSVAASIGPASAAYVHCDVTDESQVAAAVSAAVASRGRLDVMYSNAGILGSGSGSILTLDMSDFDRVMAVNARGAAAAIKHAGAAMAAAGTRGAIVVTASVSSVQAGNGPAAYTASKHAAAGIVATAAADLGRFGIRVNCVSPSGVATPFIVTDGLVGAGVTAEMVEEGLVAEANLKGVALRARHVAEAALFLASDEAAYVSGHNLLVDGGNTVVNPRYNSAAIPAASSSSPAKALTSCENGNGVV